MLSPWLLILLLLLLLLLLPGAVVGWTGAMADDEHYVRPQRSPRPVAVNSTAQRVTLSNGFVQVSFDLEHPAVDDIRGDFAGEGAYGRNTAAARPNTLKRGGIVLERIYMEPDQDIWPIPAASSRCAGPDMAVQHLVETEQRAVVRIIGVADDCDTAHAAINSTWTLELRAGDRHFGLSVDAEVISTSKDVAAVAVGLYLEDPMTVGIFDEGTIATQGSTYPYFPASSASVPRVYSLGRSSSLDISAIRSNTASNLSTVLLNSGDGSSWFSSGVQLLLAGSFPSGDGTGSAAPGINQWSNNYQFPVRHQLSMGQRMGLSLEARPNNKPFPLSTLHSTVLSQQDMEGIQSMLMGSYAAAAGCLFTYQSQMTNGSTMSGTALISDEQLHPRRSNYHGLYNFFDPSGYFHISNLLASGDSRLIADARRLLDTVARAQQPSGELPHHFQDAQPVFTAISGATLPATNLFWIKAALRYVAETGDMAWLRQRLEIIARAAQFLVRMLPADHSEPRLLKTSGALMIDVFRRGNFTTDANALAVDVFTELSRMFLYLSNSQAAGLYADTAFNISSALNERLWRHDHFATQLNPDGSERDFVDYDSNLLATAFVPMGSERLHATLRRVDNGSCTHAAPGTYISEKLYGHNDVYNCDAAKPEIFCVGDSRVSYGRVAWLDALSRKRAGDYKTFEELIVAPIRREVFELVWCHERYTCNGVPVHSPMYYEYPEVLGTITRDVRYGLRFGLGSFSIDPFLSDDDRADGFSWSIGGVHVQYNSPFRVCFALPVEWPRGLKTSIAGLKAEAPYAYNATGGSGIVRTDERGTLEVTLQASAGTTSCVVAQGGEDTY